MDIPQSIAVRMYFLQPCLIFVSFLLKIQIPRGVRPWLGNALAPLLNPLWLQIGWRSFSSKKRSLLTKEGEMDTEPTKMSTVLFCNSSLSHSPSRTYSSVWFFLTINSEFWEYGYKIIYLMKYFSVDILLMFYSISNSATESIFVCRSFYTDANILRIYAQKWNFWVTGYTCKFLKDIVKLPSWGL